MMLYDMKLIDPDVHKKLTGFSNERILGNLTYVADYIRFHVYPRQLWVRTPIIPDATAFHENISGIGQWIVQNLKDVISRWELCAFNNLCRDKYLRLDQKWAFHDAPLLSAGFMEELAQPQGIPSSTRRLFPGRDRQGYNIKKLRIKNYE